MKTIRATLHQSAVVLTVVAAIGGSGVVLVQAQQAPAPASICARSERLLTNDDREAIAKVFRDRVKEKLGLSDQQA